MSPETTTPTVEKKLAESCAASGVPVRVEDPTVLARVARLLLGGREADSEREA